MTAIDLCILTTQSHLINNICFPRLSQYRNKHDKKKKYKRMQTRLKKLPKFKQDKKKKCYTIT